MVNKEGVIKMAEHSLIEIRNAINNLPEYPQLSDIAECINEIDKILREKGYQVFKMITIGFPIGMTIGTITLCVLLRSNYEYGIGFILASWITYLATVYL